MKLENDWLDFKWEHELQSIINSYKDGTDEPLNGDEVDNLTEILRLKINFLEGNSIFRWYTINWIQIEDITEKEYGVKETTNNLKIKWEAFKKVDDYTKFYIEIGIKGSDIKEVTLKSLDINWKR